MLPLMQVLSRYDHEYHLYIDRAYRPWWDKSQKLQEERIQQGVAYISDKVDVVIVPPTAELRIQNSEFGTLILPLFETYMLEYVLKYSIVGKLGLLTDSSSSVDADTQWYISDICASYTLTEPQKKTKKFDANFPLWENSVRMWNYFLTTYGRKDWMVRKTVKTDTRYFLDAGVDTIIPMSRWFLFYQKIIKKHFNWKKIRFHGLDAVEECFARSLSNFTTPHPQPLSWEERGEYAVTLHCTDIPTPLLVERKWMDMLGRGDVESVKVVEIEIGKS